MKVIKGKEYTVYLNGDVYKNGKYQYFLDEREREYLTFKKQKLSLDHLLSMGKSVIKNLAIESININKTRPKRDITKYMTELNRGNNEYEIRLKELTSVVESANRKLPK